MFYNKTNIDIMSSRSASTDEADGFKARTVTDFNLSSWYLPMCRPLLLPDKVV
jgi:hypothetical protein